LARIRSELLQGLLGSRELLIREPSLDLIEVILEKARVVARQLGAVLALSG
jgi:hypothetical protein